MTTSPVEAFARESLAAWEKAAGTFSEALVRDPRTLALGTGMLNAGLTWKRAFDEVASQWIALASRR